MLVRGITVFASNDIHQGDMNKFGSQTIVELLHLYEVVLVVGVLAKLPAGGGTWAQQSEQPRRPRSSNVGNGIPPSTRDQNSPIPDATAFPESISSEYRRHSDLAATGVPREIDPTQAAGRSYRLHHEREQYRAHGTGINAFVYLEGQKARAVL